jgi:carboxypeptidase C (cathepsin A)
VHWLTNFYGLYPEFRSSELFIAGESFGGKYLPLYGELLVNQ